MKPTIDLSVYLVTDPMLCAAHGPVGTALAAVRGGVRVVQLRDKSASDKALIRQGRELKAALAGSGARLIVNDRIEVASAIGADGVHLGQADADAASARVALGADALIGASIHSAEQAMAVDPELVDYVGVGPVFATATKPDHELPLGLDGLAEVCSTSPLPAIAIGGLTLADVHRVFAAGARGLAVVSAICGTQDPETAARALVEAAHTSTST